MILLWKDCGSVNNWACLDQFLTDETGLKFITRARQLELLKMFDIELCLKKGDEIKTYDSSCHWTTEYESDVFLRFRDPAQETMFKLKYF